MADVLAVVGPTCSGKSSIAIELARKYGCGVLSADSMQVYVGMDIGTGKAFDAGEGVEFFGIDITDPTRPYSAALYQEYGRRVISQQLKQHGKAIICGGTGFYIRALLDDMDFAEGEQENNPIRQKYQQILDENGPQAVWEALYALDPDSAGVIAPANTKRVIRALEMLAAGESYAERAAAFAEIPEAIPATYVAFDYPREMLYDAINKRVDAMFAAGLVDEVRGLVGAGLDKTITAQQAIGYKEIFAYLRGECTLEESSEAIKQATRRYAKRQLSWFRRDKRINWIDGLLPQAEKLACVEELAGW